MGYLHSHRIGHWHVNSVRLVVMIMMGNLKDVYLLVVSTAIYVIRDWVGDWDVCHLFLHILSAPAHAAALRQKVSKQKGFQSFVTCLNLLLFQKQH